MVGFSLGANIVGKFIVENPDSGISAAVCVNGPMNEKFSIHLEKYWFGMWTWWLAGTVKRQFIQHTHMFD